jgi:transcriptional regulator
MFSVARRQAVYIPKAYEETRTEVLHKLIDLHPFAALVTMGESGIVASHIPMVLDRTGGAAGILRGHLSRANTQWKDRRADVEALAIFSGPQHYISPAWYPEKQESGRVVPTWNYVVVHAYGPLRVIEDAAWLRPHLEKLTAMHEASAATPWTIDDAPEEYIASQIKGIVGVEMEIARLEGKWKLSQNRPERDRCGVRDGLGRLGAEPSASMRALMDAKE